MPAPASTRSSQIRAPPILSAKNTSQSTNSTTTMVQIRLTTNDSSSVERRSHHDSVDIRLHFRPIRVNALSWLAGGRGYLPPPWGVGASVEVLNEVAAEHHEADVFWVAKDRRIL